MIEIDLAGDIAQYGWGGLEWPDTVPVVDCGHAEPGLDATLAARHYEEHAVGHAERLRDAVYAVEAADEHDYVSWDLRRVDGQMRLVGLNIYRGARR